MNEGFYRAFEDKYRGSRELILGRLNAYAPLLKTLRTAFPEGQAVDLGCGRGEWLELLSSFGISATGVDLDEGMLAACRERGYDVVCEDAIGYLADLPTESLSLVSAFHLVEHIPFQALAQLVSEALRVLKPGGILIMETPNPENVCVGTESFYLDPSHVRPIPPKLLSFLPEYIGFGRTTVLRLQEPMELAYQQEVTLHDVLTGVSPDYAVLTQKAAAESVMALFDASFTTTMGLTLEKLSQAFNKRLVRIETEYDQAIERYAQIVNEYDQAVKRYAQIVDEYALKVDVLGAELVAVYNSSSWRVTRPLRQLVDFVRQQEVFSLRFPLRMAMQLVGAVPGAKALATLLLKPFPRLRLRLMYLKRGEPTGAFSAGSFQPGATRKQAIAYNVANLSTGSDAPVEEIIERINRELESRT